MASIHPIHQAARAGAAAAPPRVLARLAVLALTLCAAGCGPPAERPGTPPRHLVLITVEHIRPDHMTALGYDRHTTGLLKLDQPYVLDIDYLGHRGVSFAHVMAPSSDDSLSLANLMTGALPLSEGKLRVGGALPEQPSTLAEDLASKGFLTAAFVNGSSLSGAERGAGGLARGFERASFYASDEEMLTAAVGWLSAQVSGKTPLFLWIHLAGIRPPFAGEALADRFSKGDYAGYVRPEPEFFERLRAGEVELSANDHQRLRDLYDGRLRRVTELLNSFFFLYRNTIAGGKLWKDSLIVIAGTSGCELAERGGRVASEDCLRESGLNVPLQLWHPGSLTGERVLDTVVELGDLAATLRDWFGVQAPGSATGQSLLALTDSYVQGAFERRGGLSLAHAGPELTGATLRSRRWRLILEGEHAQLFDLEHDPGERHEIAEDLPQVVAELRAQLSARLRAVGL